MGTNMLLQSNKRFHPRFIETTGKSRNGKLELRYDQTSQGFVAVSYRWYLGNPRDERAEKYFIEKPAGMQKIVLPQDVVPDRTISFARAVKLPFWIDKLCIDQAEQSDEHEIAMKSMDLIYKRSQHTIGLPFIRLDARAQIRALSDLLAGGCVMNPPSKGTESIDVCYNKRAREVLDVIELVLSDPWWEKAWIFQEEYISSKRMQLLIRSDAVGSDGFPCVNSSIPGELAINAVNFRRSVSIFCRAFRSSPCSSRRDRGVCQKVLQKAARYDVLLRQDAQNKPWKPLSPRVFENIAARSISVRSDMLDIISNCCDYTTRLNAKSLQQNKSSLSLALLAIFILNGELIDHSALALSDSCDNVLQFLHRFSLRVEAPVGKGGLSFIKHCRLPEVELTATGIRTTGILWHLALSISGYRMIGSSSSNSSAPADIRQARARLLENRGQGRKRLYLHPGEFQTLWLFCQTLRRWNNPGLRQLSSRIQNFLLRTAPYGFLRDFSWRQMMHVMVAKLAKAIERRKRLLFGRIHGTDASLGYNAIFLPGARSDIREGSFAFTSWTRATCLMKGDMMSRSCAKFVSLAVDGPLSLEDVASIVSRSWINGLCFFTNDDAVEINIPWPPSLTT